MEQYKKPIMKITDLEKVDVLTDSNPTPTPTDSLDDVLASITPVGKGLPDTLMSTYEAH